MTIAQQDVLDSIASLRKDYARASEERRATILKEIDTLKEVNKLVVCYRENCKRLLFKDAFDPSYPFHDVACHKLWADSNYGKPGEPKHRPSIAELQRRLNEMAKEVHLNGIPGRQQKLL